MSDYINTFTTADIRPGPKDAHSTVLRIEEEAMIVAFRNRLMPFLRRHRHVLDRLSLAPLQNRLLVDAEPLSELRDRSFRSL